MDKRFSWVVGSLFLLVILGFFLRTYALWRDLVFVYDQGRDALAVQKILMGDLTLIGPTTGLSGVFLGPFFYYLLVPLYVLGNGNPIVPMYGLAFMQACVAVLLYLLARDIAGKKAGIFAAFLYTISFQQIMFARWLSNPTPLPFFSGLLILSYLRGMSAKNAVWFLLVGLLLGICMQLEAANAVFYIPTLLLIAIIEARTFPEFIAGRGTQLTRYWRVIRTRFQWILLAVAGFSLMLAPQALFEVRHNFLTTQNLLRSFQTTHEVTLLASIGPRLQLLWQLYARAWFPHAPWIFGLTVIGTLICALAVRSRLWGKRAFRMIVVWFTVPFILHALYTGNHGNFWDYYVIAQHGPLYVLIASCVFMAATHAKKLRLLSYLLIVGILLAACLTNMREWAGFLRPFEKRIALSLQMDAVDWIRQHAQGEPFGIWVYTPNFQDDAYRYIIDYKGKKTGIYPEKHPEQTKRMYFIVEDDPVFWKRRQEWLAEKTAIGTVVAEKGFGGVTVFALQRH